MSDEAERGRVDRLVMRLRDMAEEMDAVAAEMETLAHARWDGELRDHATDLRGAAGIARTWSEGIASETIARIPSEWCGSYACEKLGGAMQKQRCIQSDGQPCFCWAAA